MKEAWTEGGRHLGHITHKRLNPGDLREPSRVLSQGRLWKVFWDA